MNGLLSQAIANLNTAAQQVSTLSGLPPEAQALQSKIAAAVAPLVTQIQGMQKTGARFVTNALAQLNELLGLIASGQPMSDLKPKLALVLGEVGAMETTVDKVSAQIAVFSTMVFGDFNQLATIQANLGNQMSALNGQLTNAQGEEDAARKRYYYLLALGPFGLIGLAVALGLYFKWRSDVNGYESQISALNAQIGTFMAMQNACKLLDSDFRSVISKTSGVKNTTDFVNASLQEINKDLGAGVDRTTLDIVVRASITEVTTLSVDIS